MDLGKGMVKERVTLTSNPKRNAKPGGIATMFSNKYVFKWYFKSSKGGVTCVSKAKCTVVKDSQFEPVGLDLFVRWQTTLQA
ncbi:hypothetical protein MTR_0321s0020 [Medicago truncatula]|uniref:Uncharacterized protein n=1 Tax=Medicago truncatula TaxID=3880 RepID=A0A072TEX0_MEDTR|nr:hypothetical protein MTR_0321s0020 [Medicago truncatula]